MTYGDFHIHTTFCDGADTAEDIALEAIRLGIKRIGFSGHSYTFFDESYCMSKKGTREYVKEIARLKDKYRGVLEIYCGIEQDFYSGESTDCYDYVIGSVHYLKKNGVYFPVDETAKLLTCAAREHYDGDFYALAEDYFETVSRSAERTRADIIGHFDLISKFNEAHKLFYERNERYITAYKKAIDALAEYDIPFEINTGAISRGCKSEPYPSAAILEYINEKGCKTILSSDSHSKDTLCFGFEKYNSVYEFKIPERF